MKEKAIEIALELNQIKNSLQTYKEQTKFLQSINENLMTANKRLREDLEEKEADYQKLLSISKDILKEKRTIQKQFEHMKTQSKEVHNTVQRITFLLMFKELQGLYLKYFAQINRCVRKIVQSQSFHQKMRFL